MGNVNTFQVGIWTGNEKDMPKEFQPIGKVQRKDGEKPSEKDAAIVIVTTENTTSCSFEGYNGGIVVGLMNMIERMREDENLGTDLALALIGTIDGKKDLVEKVIEGKIKAEEVLKK